MGGQNHDFDTLLPPFAWFRWGTGTKKGFHFRVILGAKFATILLLGRAGPYFWMFLEPFETRVAFGRLGVPSVQVRPYLSHDLSHTLGKGGGPDWKVSPPQGEDNRRGRNTSHTPHDPKGSADLIGLLFRFLLFLSPRRVETGPGGI